MPKVFISFDYNDINSKKVVDNWMHQNIGADISFSSEEGHSHSPKGEDFVKQIPVNIKCSYKKRTLWVFSI